MESFNSVKQGKFCKFSLSHRLIELEERFKANGGEYRGYKLKDLFDIDNTWIYGKNKQYITRLKYPTESSIAVISGITVNNGVNYYTEDVLNENEVYCDCLTITTRGEYSGTVKYHDEKFCLANNILTMPMPLWSKKSKLYIATLIQNLKYGGYAGYPRKETLKDDSIFIPTKNNQIDFDYMEERIRVLEEERIRVLDTYLKVIGVGNCELTENEIEVIRKINCHEIEFKKFNITGEKGIFTVKNTGNILQSSITPNSGIFPYLTASQNNNSVSTYISYDTNSLEKGNSIFIGGKTLVITYQEQDYFSNDSHNLALYLRNKDNLSRRGQLFLVSMLYKSLKPKYIWNASISKEKIQNDVVYLPVNENDEIDFELMEKYICAIEKKVIKNVIEWKDKVIEKTKEVVNKE